MLILAGISILLRQVAVGVVFGALAAAAHVLCRSQKPSPHAPTTPAAYGGTEDSSRAATPIDLLNYLITPDESVVCSKNKERGSNPPVFSGFSAWLAHPHAKHTRGASADICAVAEYCKAIRVRAIATNTLNELVEFCKTRVVPAGMSIHDIGLMRQTGVPAKKHTPPLRETCGTTLFRILHCCRPMYSHIVSVPRPAGIVLLQNMVECCATAYAVCVGKDMTNMPFDKYSTQQKRFILALVAPTHAENAILHNRKWVNDHMPKPPASMYSAYSFADIQKLLKGLTASSLFRLFRGGTILHDISTCVSADDIAGVVYGDIDNEEHRLLQLDICFPKNIILYRTHERTHTHERNSERTCVAPILIYPPAETQYDPIGYIMIGFVANNRYISTGIYANPQGGSVESAKSSGFFNDLQCAEYILYERIHPKIRESIGGEVAARVYGPASKDAKYADAYIETWNKPQTVADCINLLAALKQKLESVCTRSTGTADDVGDVGEPTSVEAGNKKADGTAGSTGDKTTNDSEGADKSAGRSTQIASSDRTNTYTLANNVAATTAASVCADIYKTLWHNLGDKDMAEHGTTWMPGYIYSYFNILRECIRNNIKIQTGTEPPGETIAISNDMRVKMYYYCHCSEMFILLQKCIANTPDTQPGAADCVALQMSDYLAANLSGIRKYCLKNTYMSAYRILKDARNPQYNLCLIAVCVLRFYSRPTVTDFLQKHTPHTLPDEIDMCMAYFTECGTALFPGIPESSVIPECKHITDIHHITDIRIKTVFDTNVRKVISGTTHDDKAKSVQTLLQDVIDAFVLWIRYISTVCCIATGMSKKLGMVQDSVMRGHSHGRLCIDINFAIHDMYSKIKKSHEIHTNIIDKFNELLPLWDEHKKSLEESKSPGV